MTEHLMSVNNKQLPTTLKGLDGDKVMIMRLILMEPGLIQTHPEMGVGLVSKYRYKDIESIKNDLPNNIKRQMSMYLPYIHDIDVQVGFHVLNSGESHILITIISNEIHTIITVNEETRTLVSLK